jgi:hypothetical protein
MSKSKEPVAPAEKVPSFEVLGLVKSDFMPMVIDGRQVDFANVTPEVTAWLHARRDQLPWLRWKE